MGARIKISYSIFYTKIDYVECKRVLRIVDGLQRESVGGWQYYCSVGGVRIAVVSSIEGYD